MARKAGSGIGSLYFDKRKNKWVLQRYIVDYDTNKTKISPQQSFLILGIVFTAIMSVVLMWMKSRLGLKPEEYRKEDIEYN